MLARPKVAAAAVLISIAALGGCTSKEKVLPQDGPTMLDIYNGHLARAGEPYQREGRAKEAGAQERPASAQSMREVRAELRGQVVTDQDARLVAYTRDVHNEIENLFPTLPNPTLVMYVYPHLAGEENMPVPGYSTSFSLYQRTEYALPGEVSVPGPQPLPPVTSPGDIEPVRAAATSR